MSNDLISAVSSIHKATSVFEELYADLLDKRRALTLCEKIALVQFAFAVRQALRVADAIDKDTGQRVVLTN